MTKNYHDKNSSVKGERRIIGDHRKRLTKNELEIRLKIMNNKFGTPLPPLSSSYEDMENYYNNVKKLINEKQNDNDKLLHNSIQSLSFEEINLNDTNVKKQSCWSLFCNWIKSNCGCLKREND